MENDRRVLSRLDDLVEVTDASFPRCARQRPVHPRGLTTTQQEAPDEVSGGEIVVAGDRDERPSEVVGHGFDEARLPAPGRTLEEHRQLLIECRLEDLLFVADRDVVRPDAGAHATLLRSRSSSSLE